MRVFPPPFANEPAQRNDPVRNQWQRKPICISYRVGWTHGKLDKSLFFPHKSTTFVPAKVKGYNRVCEERQSKFALYVTGPAAASIVEKLANSITMQRPGW